MLPQLCFFVSIAFGLIAWGIVAARYIWPKLRHLRRAEALRPAFALPSVLPGRGSAEARRGERTVRIEARDTACAVFERDALGAGDRLHGPAIVAGVDATCLLLPGQHAEVDGVGNLLIRDA